MDSQRRWVEAPGTQSTNYSISDTIPRTIDLADISRVLGRATRDELQAVREVVARFGYAADVADLEQLVQMGLLERYGNDPTEEGIQPT